MLTFLALLTPVLVLAWLLTSISMRHLPFVGTGRGLLMVAIAVLLVQALGLIAHRLFLRALPLRAGEISAGSRQEFIYQVYILFYLILFNSMLRAQFIPIPLMRLVYLALGARLGPNTYTSGIIFDPLFVTVGSNCMIGETTLLLPHVIEGERLGHFPIHIGNNVTIGAHAIILAGVTIGDNVIVAANSVVAKHRILLRGEMWGGSPARRLR